MIQQSSIRQLGGAAADGVSVCLVGFAATELALALGIVVIGLLACGAF
jgi:hypothetical protein